MFVVLWEFDVKQECEERFTFAYAASGDWARLFRTDPNFRETRLLRNISAPLRYVTLDVWRSREDYEEFLRRNVAVYTALDAQCAGWTTMERHLSSFDADLG
jgi:heme-degrading monooxygenase HmoA